MMARPLARQARPRKLPTRDKDAILAAEERPVLVFGSNISEIHVIKPARSSDQKMTPNGFNGRHS